MHENLTFGSFQQARERLKNLEEHVEAERASHLETKFNSEIVQVPTENQDTVPAIVLNGLPC
jgi:hypothetical protein